MDNKLAEAIKKAKVEKIQSQDVYKLAKAPREVKGISRYGEERWGYVYSPELFVKSDATGRMCRFFIEVDGFTFHPDEISAAKIEKDGTVKIVNSESLQVTDPVNDRRKTFRSLDSALWEIVSLLGSKDGRNVNADICTIENKKTGKSFTMTRGEWREVQKIEKRFSRGWEVTTSFSEMAERLEG